MFGLFTFLYLMSSLSRCETSVKEAKGVSNLAENTSTAKHPQIKNVSDLVSDQYRDLPYPPFPKERIMREMQHYLNMPQPITIVRSLALDSLNYYLFQGQQSFDQGFRFLVAGGGTGTSTNFMAEQLRGKKAEVVYLDFSKASMKMSRERAKIRRLKNIRWFKDKIENIPNIQLGQFDVIESSGVVHHMPHPAAGLRILANSMKKNGGMVLMLYAKYGRTGIYQMQDMLKIINEGVTDREEELENTWQVLQSFHETDRMVRFDYNAVAARGKDFYTRARDGVQDAEMYDRYCHKQDTAFTVQEFYDIVESVGLQLVDRSDYLDRLTYDVNNIADTELRDLIRADDHVTHESILELFLGSQSRHQYYLTKQSGPLADFLPDLVPYFPYYSQKELVWDQLIRAASGDAIRQSDATLRLVKNGRLEATVPVKLSDYTLPILNRIGGELTIREIYEQIMASTDLKKLSLEDFLAHFQEVFEPLRKADVLLMKHKSVRIKYPWEDLLK